jgi:membrane associated rhomboid family serine protease
LRQTLAETIISFLLGAAWALVLLGAIFLFWSFLPFGVVIALMAALVGSIFGLLSVVLLEVAALQFEKMRELRRQTKILEAIKVSLDSSDDVALRDH